MPASCSRDLRSGLWIRLGLFPALLLGLGLAGLSCGGGDGGGSGVTEPEPEPNRAPTVSIEAPAPDTTATQGDEVVFVGSAQDPEDGSLTGGALTWSSDVDGELGTGAELTAADLEQGSHTVTLTATDSEGATAADEVGLTIRGPFKPETDVELSGDQKFTDVEVAEGVTVTVTDDVSIEATGAVSIAGEVAGDCVEAALTSDSTLTITGTVNTACGELPDGEAPRLRLVGDGGFQLDGATVTASGDVLVTSEPDATFETDTTEEASQSPSRGATSGASRSTSAGMGLQSEAERRTCSFSGTIQHEPRKARDGETGGPVGGAGADGADIKITCGAGLGPLEVSGTLEPQNGGDGGRARDEGARDTEATGGAGGGAGVVWLEVIAVGGGFGEIRVRDPFVVERADGGNGGRATAIAEQSGPAQEPAPSATATGGDGGNSRITVTYGSPAGDVEPGEALGTGGSGGNGGDATARAADGSDATGSDPAQVGGNAVAKGGIGGVGFVGGDVGSGGKADATAGNGGAGSRAFPNGAEGGFVKALSGTGPLHAVELEGEVLAGDIVVDGGNGGDGWDGCREEAAAGGDGGDAFVGSFDPSEAGFRGNFILPDGFQTDELALVDGFGNGGDGGTGEPAGEGGSGGHLTNAFNPVTGGQFTYLGENEEPGASPDDGCPTTGDGADLIGFSFQRQDESSSEARIGFIGPDGNDLRDLGRPPEGGFLASVGWVATGDLVFERNPSGDVPPQVAGASAVSGEIVLLTDGEGGAEDPSPTPGGDVAFVQTSITGSGVAGRGADAGPLRQSAGAEEIFVMQPDGSGKTQVSDAPELAKSGPVGGPDGRIYFLGQPAGGNNDVYRVDRDGSDLTNLTNSPEGETDVQVSPDGTRIAFRRTVEENGRFLRRLWVANADGSGERQVAPELDEARAPDWSPDGTSLVFVGSAGFGQMEDLYRANADGSGVENLTNTENRAESNPDWAPSGEFVAYRSIFFDDEVGASVGELFRMNPDGTAQTQLTDLDGTVEEVAVQP